MKLIRSLAGAAMALACGLAASAASAAPVFMSIPDLTVAPLQNAYCSSCGGFFQASDTFTLSSAATINDLQFAVQTNYHFPTDVTVSIFSGTAAAPGASLFSATYAPSSFSSVTNTPNNTSIVRVAIPGLSLGAGSYAISFFNPSNLGVPGYGGGSGELLLNDPSYGTFPTGQSAAFALSGSAAPGAPGPQVGLGLIPALAALAGLALTRLRRPRIRPAFG